MSTENENGNEQYIFRYKDEHCSDVITYKTNLVKKIQAHKQAKEMADIQSFPENISGKKFERFIETAKSEGFTIYQVTKK